MRLLLDTHVWLWMLTTPERLNEPPAPPSPIQRNEVVLSAASAWEVAIKHELGKLPLNGSPSQLVEVSVRELKVNVLPITISHALAAATLPLHHKDPFDRMLVAQAGLEELRFVTADGVIRQYGGVLLWAG